LEETSAENEIPILFKQYDGGKFTDEIIKYAISSLRISCVKGEGVQFESLSGGKILMLVGGTGIYPLSDLIDMLYKSALAKQKP
jgi:NAD(P)H-flavin reductase